MKTTLLSILFIFLSFTLTFAQQTKTRYYDQKSTYKGYSVEEYGGKTRYYTPDSKYQGYSTKDYNGTERYYTPDSKYKGYGKEGLNSVQKGSKGSKR